MKEKQSLSEIHLKSDAHNITCRPAVIWTRPGVVGCFLGELLCLRPGSVKHIISVFLHAIMQNMHVIATESVLSELCYCNVSIRKSQQTSSGPGTHFSIGPGEVPLGEIRPATAATYLIQSSVFK